MQKLESQEYSLAAPLLLEFKHYTMVHTILSGKTPGLVYLNKLENPQIAFTQFRHRALICGSRKAMDDKNLRHFFLNVVLENCRRFDVPLFRLTSNDPAWIIYISDCLEDCEPILTDYQCYRYRITSNIKKINIPDSFSLQEVTADLINGNFEGKDDLLDEMCSERESVDAFLQHSFGIVAFHGNKLAGWCLSEYNHKNRCEVGVATMPEFKRQGLATAMAKSFLNQAYKCGIDTVLWHCYKSNIGSRKTALSTGFSLHKEEQVLLFYLDRTVNSAVHGNIYYKQHQYQEALSWYKKALLNDISQSWIAWNAACAAAHTDQVDLAFDYINQAIDLGFSDLEHLIQSEELQPLKSNPKWDIIIRRISHNLPS